MLIGNEDIYRALQAHNAGLLYVTALDVMSVTGPIMSHEKARWLAEIEPYMRVAPNGSKDWPTSPSMVRAMWVSWAGATADKLRQFAVEKRALEMLAEVMGESAPVVD